jgi:CBS domain-containing protein
MNESVRDVMTLAPCALSTRDTVTTAAQVMRENDIGDVIVLEGSRLFGILTDRDIVVRALAEGADLQATTVDRICSRELTVIGPSASVGEAVRLMRDKAIRRLPVVDEHGEVVGIVSLGDVAVERDRRTALADISAAPPNE